MFTKTIFNLCKLQFVSKYVQFAYKLREGSPTFERPRKIFFYSYLNNGVTVHETDIYIILISQSIFH